MENKEVEMLLNSIQEKAEKPLLDFERIDIQTDVVKLYVKFDELKKENANLKQQLQAKDKALDKAIESRECWKEWCEDEIF